MNTVKYKNNKSDLQYQFLIEHPESFPFSFKYNGKKYEGFGKDFSLISSNVEKGDSKTTNTFCFRLDETLQISLKCAHYENYGATEFTVWFENNGNKNSGIISEAITTLRFNGSYPMLKGILGDHDNWYRPYAMDVSSNPVHFESNSGRPTHISFPYFNLEYGDGGALLAIGWSGTWRADFRYNKNTNTTTYTAKSVNMLNTYLLPDEKIRTALFVFMPYEVREENYATNLWRSWFIECNLPKADKNGTAVKPFSTCCLASDTGIPNSDGSISECYYTWKPSLEKMLEEDVSVDFRWLDAGWYIAPSGASPDGLTIENDWHTTIGTWTLDPKKWPDKTFLESTDFAREHGMKTLMWFEPERVCDVPNLVKKYGYKEEWAIKGYVNNIGNPECLKWTLDRITKTLSENKVEMYREDNNCNPGEIWHYLDDVEGESRKGITEAKVVDAHYRMWDAIIACTTSYGGYGFVDSCASGGGRNDLESLRRGIPLLRSDYDRTSTSLRLSMTTSFNKWVPFCGTINKEKGWQLDATGVLDKYVWRASYLPIVDVDSQFVQDPNQDFSVLRNGLKEWKKVNKYLTADFYVLTHWHTEGEKSDFTAYAFFNPEEGKGVLFLFRQEECKESDISVTLPFVTEGIKCTLTDEDSGEKLTFDGKEMAENGINFTMDEPRSSRLLWIVLTK